MTQAIHCCRGQYLVLKCRFPLLKVQIAGDQRCSSFITLRYDIVKIFILALSNAAVDAVVLPSLKARGDDIGFADFALDMVFGAALGGLFSGAGYGMSKWARHNIHGEDRLAVLNSFEDSVARVADGQPVNVGPILKGTNISVYRDADPERHPLSPKREAPASPARLATKSQNLDGDTAVGTSARDQQGQGLEETVSNIPEGVNPFAVEQPDTFLPAPEPANRTALGEMGADKNGVTPEEILAEQFADTVPQEHIAELRQAQEQELVRKQREDVGYEIMGCVFGVNDGD
jgi:hypothetical protein